MIVIDTSALIESLSGRPGAARKLRELIAGGERILLPTLVLYEWWRRPRTEEELAAQEELFPSETALPFGEREARVAAGLYRTLSRPRGREIDLAIAAVAIAREAALWTLNPEDFADIENLPLVE